jgi:hypothetical protein
MRAEPGGSDRWPVSTPVDVMLGRVRVRAGALRRRRRRQAVAVAAASPLAAFALLLAVLWFPSGQSHANVRVVPPAGVSDTTTTAPLSGGAGAGEATVRMAGPTQAAASSSESVAAESVGSGAAIPASATGRIAFVRDTRIWIVNADGSDAAPLTHTNDNLFSPSWSPDGKRLLATWWVNGMTRLAVLELDGSYRFITPATAQVGESRWSPDGAHVAVTILRDVTTPASPSAVWVVRPDGTQARRLDAGIGSDWLPDGRHVLYKCSDKFCVTSLDGSDRSTLPFSAYSYNRPRVSPDGTRLLLTKLAPNGAVLVRINLDGTDERVVSPEGGPIYDWSVDGQWIAFDRSYPAPPRVCDVAATCPSKLLNVWLIRADLTDMHQLTDGDWDNNADFGPSG